MAEAVTTVAAPMDEAKETEEMDNQELLQLLRADMSAAERRSDRRFDELKQELKADIKRVETQVKEVKQELKAEIGGVKKELKTEIGGVKAEVGSLRQELKAEIKDTKQEVMTYVDTRIDDLREFITAGRLIKNNWRAFLVAALATAAVLGTFILQLLEAIR